jgi:hypothetical protein
VGVGRCGEGTYLASLVLGDLVLGVLVAVLGLAVRPAGFGDVDLYGDVMSICFLVLLCQVRVRSPVRNSCGRGDIGRSDQVVFSS